MESRNIRQLVFWCPIFFLNSELIRAQDFNALFLRLADGEGEHAVVEVDGIDAGAAGEGCVWNFCRTDITTS